MSRFTEDEINQILRNNCIDVKADEVKDIPMWISGVATKEKPVLLTIGLGTCRGVIVKTKGFAFLSHIDMGIGGSSWIYSDERRGRFRGEKPIGCRVGEEAYKELLNRKREITEPIEIVYVIGSDPDFPYDEKVDLLKNSLNQLEQKCINTFGVPVERKEMQAEGILVDSRNGKICQLWSIELRKLEDHFKVKLKPAIAIVKENRNITMEQLLETIEDRKKSKRERT